MVKTVLKIDGMMCGMCESHMNDLIRNHCKVKKVSSSAKKGETVADIFMGSGTTAIACKSLGLDYIGSELDKDYFEIINKRLQSVQGSLF